MKKQFTVQDDPSLLANPTLAGVSVDALGAGIRKKLELQKAAYDAFQKQEDAKMIRAQPARRMASAR